ncbi:RagB/SusD family nutrient uptake outer membrane protein [Carboxylicivirga sp. M1479]|uniref:RagB/SusD family nutrient uptake outer membrane protein n=1 Tax=Carboxylicivirga sp. M1479 TaxID=2594476 RepID=UPI001178A0FA|nr:RagB/SusD family nutrient uptake outer membrane protein [Carboxylicivirga sp. M1479]TRX70199.1 RagB/SusD family nutrient uptake outer membrane protein [Carboxylicivirga sp. M1479]
MKKILVYIMSVILLVSAGCTDFLTEEVFDMKTSNNFFTKEADLDLAITGVYSTVADVYRQKTIEMLLYNSGAFNKRKSTHDFIGGNYTSLHKDIAEVWQYLYKTIDSTNDLLSNTMKMGDAASEEKKNAIMAEARFLRAWSYFMVVRMFTKGPLKLEPTTSLDNAYVDVSSGEALYDKVIMPDLQYALEFLPDEPINIGRVTKGAAAAVLAKVYITLAGNDENSPYWVQARDMAQWVMTNGGYSLAPDFADLWLTKNTGEAIFEVQFMRGLETGSAYSKLFNPSGSGWSAKNGGWGRCTCTQKNYDDFANLYPGDYRIDVTFTAEYLDVNKNKLTPVYPTDGYNKNSGAWPYIAKWKDPEAPDNAAGDNNFIVIRYADVLLMFAEAENEVNGPTDDAYNAIDEVLNRARNANGTTRLEPANWERTLDKAGFREKVWNERRFELTAEQHLFFDLVRKGWDKFRTFKEDDNTYGRKIVKHGVFERNMYYPIPSLEIAANDSINVSDQNQGY